MKEITELWGGSPRPFYILLYTSSPKLAYHSQRHHLTEKDILLAVARIVNLRYYSGLTYSSHRHLSN
jgi:hypothetical protein